MKPIPKKKKSVWQQDRLNATTKLLFKKKFKQRLNLADMQKIWSDYVEEMSKDLAKGTVVNLTKNTKIWVKATPMVEHKKAMALFEKGLMYFGGKIVPANINLDTSKYIYDVVLESNLHRECKRIYFQPHKNISKTVREGIISGKLVTRI